MPEVDYKNRELDERFKNLDTLIREKHDDVMVKISGLDLKVTFTNGKVRKTIIALVLMAGIIIGQALTGKEIITALIGAHI